MEFEEDKNPEAAEADFNGAALSDDALDVEDDLGDDLLGDLGEDVDEDEEEEDLSLGLRDDI